MCDWTFCCTATGGLWEWATCAPAGVKSVFPLTGAPLTEAEFTLIGFCSKKKKNSYQNNIHIYKWSNELIFTVRPVQSSASFAGRSDTGALCCTMRIPPAFTVNEYYDVSLFSMIFGKRLHNAIVWHACMCVCGYFISNLWVKELIGQRYCIEWASYMPPT